MRTLKHAALLTAMLLFGLCGTALGQRHTIKGLVQDSTGEAMPGTTVLLMQQADSALVTFGLSNAQGGFSLPNIPEGRYVLQLSFLGYQHYRLPLSVKPEDPATMDLGPIRLGQSGIELGGVTISADIIPVVFKKDTIEYNAAAFKTLPDDKVEDLLKRLPGMQVDAEGNITAQGEKVQKVLVDGKEFFGNDPKAATRNLPANAVDKVQVFDKKSDVAEFTGVDDGTSTKTINLKIKEDFKQGLFGNAEVGVGTDEDLDPWRYKGRFSINRFQKKTQIATLGMLNNINEQGFYGQDYMDFMGMTGAGNPGGSIAPPMYNAQQNGVVMTGAAGLNFNWTPTKATKFNASYFFTGVGNTVDRTLLKTTFAEAGTFQTDEHNDQYTWTGAHKVALRLDQEIDSMQAITLRASGNLQGGHTESDDTRLNTREAAPVNQALSTYTNDVNAWDGELSAQYKRKFRKKGRAVVLDAKGSMSQSEGVAILDSRSIFFDPATGSLVGTDTILQDQVTEGGQIKYSGKLSYTEPLSQKHFLETSISHAYTGNESDKSIFDLESIGEAGTLNTLLSNSFLSTYMVEKAGLSLQRNGAKSNLTLGLDGEYAFLKGDLQNTSTHIEKTFLNPLPRLRYRYNINNNYRFDASYNTNVSEPSISQLSPVIDNSDPTRISTGNPDLKAQYTHTARMGLHGFSPFSNTALFANVSGNFTQNKITNAITLDSNLVQVIRPINVDRDLSTSMFVSAATPISPLKIRVTLSGRTTYGRGFTYINTTLGAFDRFSQSGDFSIENKNKEKFDAKIGARIDYNLTRYEAAPEMGQVYINKSFYANLNWDISPKWILNTTFKYDIYGGPTFAQQALPIWRAYISRYLLKGNKLQLKLEAFDILNQNRGVNRTSDLNYVQEETFVAVGRYVMLSVGYNILGFKKQATGGMPGPGGGPGRMMRPMGPPQGGM